ncbi:MAG: xanthine dehydrogenase FAD-binding subunit XdhB, partial [Lachnospiraceae bacterium]|nr:xanthine dehydrogenase FAD-binding subunit XdhB [Lachnospiraceae bacterium]
RDSYENTNGFYIKYAMRNAMDIATLGTSVNARLSADKKSFDRVRIAYGVAGPVPLRATTAENFINGREVTMENIEAFSKEVLNDVHARDSWRAAKDFREHIAVESAKRALIESVRRCGGEI